MCFTATRNFALRFQVPPSQIPTNFPHSSFLSLAEMPNTVFRKGIFENSPNICFPVRCSFYAMVGLFFFNFLCFDLWFSLLRLSSSLVFCFSYLTAPLFASPVLFHGLGQLNLIRGSNKHCRFFTKVILLFLFTFACISSRKL